MKRELAIFFGIVILMAVALYVQQDAYRMFRNGNNGNGDKEISFEEFSDIILAKDEVVLVMNLQQNEFRDRIVIGCSIGIAKSLGSMGKTVRNYAIDGVYCIKPDLGNVSKAECLDEIDGTYFFNIGYGKGSTRFYEHKTEILVDEDFQGECDIVVVDTG
ncbi:MAG: hypothetical protein ABIG39_06500 [Candidatus Micrarchaeota archaeon]